MSHYDVVPSGSGEWIYPAFSGEIKEGYIWGRGTLDTKSTLNAIMNATETLLSKKFIPDNDIYLAFGGDEEINGNGAKLIVEYFEKNSIKPGLVLDEGGAIVDGVFPGIEKNCALIGIAEKGIMNVELIAKSAGGHASTPENNGPIKTLSRACLKIYQNPSKFRISRPAKELFDTLAPNSTFLYRLIFSNLTLFSPLLSKISASKGGELNALLRTTYAFTCMQGSVEKNVLPDSASITLNIRIIPGETVETVVDYLKKTINDDNVEIKVIHGENPSAVSVTQCEEYSKISGTIQSVWGDDVLISPYLMLACSDARHWGKISDRVYRFSPMRLSKDERGLIHASNERISIEKANKITEFYLNLISQC